MSRWTAALLDNPHLLGLSVAVLVVAGASAFLTLPRQEDPRITTRNATVVTLFPGASAARVEALVTEKLEDRLQEVTEIADIESTSRAGVSVISIELQDRVTAASNDEIFSEVRDKLADAAPDLPPRARAPVFDDKRGAVAFTLIAGITWTADEEPLLGTLGRLAEELEDALRNVPGTELVRLYGAPEEEIRVVADPAELAELGLSASGLARRLAEDDPKVPAGTLRGAGRDVQIEVAGELDSLEAVRRVAVRDGPGASLVRVGDVARVERAWREPPREIALTGGRRTVLVAARVEPGRQVDRWIEGARERVDAFRLRAGGGMRVDGVFDQSDYTVERLLSLATNLLLGAVVVVAVVVVTMGWRSALLVGSALPLVSCWTLFGVLLSGGALHQMSIFGMIIALGLLIDNGIVVVDEISRRLDEGHSGNDAAVGAVRHLFAPLLASTFTTALAFAPIVLLPGNAGDFVGYIGGSVIIAIAGSFLVSLSVIAALAGRLGRPAPTAARWWQTGLRIPGLAERARGLLRRGLEAPWKAVAVACAAPALGFAVAPTLGNEFFPPVERDMFDVRMWLPRHASVTATEEAARRVEARLLAEPDVRRVDWLIGGSFPSVYYNLVMSQDDAPFYAQAAVTTTSAEATGRLVPRLQRELPAAFPALQLVLAEFGQGPPVEADVELRLVGPDVGQLQDLGEQVRRALQHHPDVLETQVTMPRGEPRLYVDADADEARLGGLGLRELAEQLRAELEGATGGSVLEELEEMPVRVRVSDERRRSLDAVASTRFVRPAAAAGDAWTPLPALAHLELRPEPGGITRFDGVRCNIVKGFTRQGALPIDGSPQVMGGLQQRGLELPDGVRLELGGAVEQDSEATGNLLSFAPVLGAVMVATLVLVFRSVRLAGLLGAVAFLSAGLALLSTWSIGFPVSFNTLLGTFGLIGVALNDSIVVLAAILASPGARAGDRDAITDEALGTARHVVSTTLTTIGGFLPLLLFVGGDFWPSLAIVLAGGVAGASLIALVFVPAVYAWLHPPARGTAAT